MILIFFLSFFIDLCICKNHSETSHEMISNVRKYSSIKSNWECVRSSSINLIEQFCHFRFYFQNSVNSNDSHYTRCYLCVFNWRHNYLIIQELNQNSFTQVNFVFQRFRYKNQSVYSRRKLTKRKTRTWTEIRQRQKKKCRRDNFRSKNWPLQRKKEGNFCILLAMWIELK